MRKSAAPPSAKTCLLILEWSRTRLSVAASPSLTMLTKPPLGAASPRTGTAQTPQVLPAARLLQ